MLRPSLLVTLSALALASACGQPPARVQTAEAPAATTPLPAAVSNADFMQTVANSDAFEREAADLAIQHATLADVKMFARMMRTDHTATTQQLTEIAPTISEAPPEGAVGANHRMQLGALSGTHGADFDRVYVAQQVDAHQNAISAFEDYLSGAEQGPLRQWAETTLPKLRDHLANAEALQSAS